MKKRVSILSATLLATSLAACGPNEEEVVDVSTNVQMGAEVRFYDNNSLSRKLFNCMMQSVGGK